MTFLDWLHKLGILRVGTAKGTFTSATNKSDELTFHNVYDAKRDMVQKEDIQKAKEYFKRK